MSRCISDTCRDHRCLTTCQKQHRQNEPAGQVDVPTRVEVHVTVDPGQMKGQQTYHDLSKQHRQNEPAGQVDVTTRVEIHVMGKLDMCRDHRRLTTCQKQHRQNKLAGQVDIPTRVEVPVMSHCLSKTTQTA